MDICSFPKEKVSEDLMEIAVIFARLLRFEKCRHYQTKGQFIDCFLEDKFNFLKTAAIYI